MTAAIRRAGVQLCSAVNPMTRQRTSWMLGRRRVGIEVHVLRVQLPTVVIDWPVIERPEHSGEGPELALVRRSGDGTDQAELDQR